MSNPYLTGTEDDDLLNDQPSSTTKSEDNSSDSPTEGVSREVSNALNLYFGQRSDREINPLPEFSAMAGLYDFFFAYSRFSPEGPALAALGEIVDELSDGKYYRVYQLLEAERVIMLGFMLGRTLNWVEEVFSKPHPESIVGKSPYRGELNLYLKTYMSLADFRRRRAIDTYKFWCEDLGREPDETLIETGIKSSRNKYVRLGMKRPPANAEA